MSGRALLLLLCVFATAPGLARAEVTVTAVPVPGALRVDGRLDEDFYATTPAVTTFIQTEPSPGTPITEKTEMWVGFDRTNIYVSFRCWESHPERVVATELRRDNNLMTTANDNVAFGFDTFHDRRNTFVFVVNPAGGRTDGQVVGERQYSGDWNPVWSVATSRFENGWIVEAAIPFKSLRYRQGEQQTWGFTARRMSRWKNEIAYLTPVPDGSQAQALMWSSFYATLDGIKAPSGAKNLEVKPYATSHLTTDRTVTPRIVNDPGADVGVDAKYGISQNLTADITYNTDFAQVEADEQQVNLTRFSLFFPEKRDFFLENAGMFAFGGAGAVGSTSTADVPVLFYSRRIGLEAGRAIPIVAGGRVTGRVGGVEVGLLNIEAGDEPVAQVSRTNFGAVRLKRDILRKSSIGAIVTRRSEAPGRPGVSSTYGADGRFAFGKSLLFNTYWARSDTGGISRDDVSYRGQLDYNADRYGVQAERVVVGRNFSPEMGFVRRPDMRKSYGALRFSPRPTQSVVKKYSWSGAISHIDNGTGRLETQEADGDFSMELQNSDKLLFGVTNQYEFLPAPFLIASGVTIPVGGYHYTIGRAGFNFGQQRNVFANVSLQTGGFYDGHATTVSVLGARAAITRLLSVEPTASVSHVDLVAGRFRTLLAGSRITYTMTPLMFVSALLQYNSSTNSLSSNVRLRWEYRPGSELFIVYNEQRDTTGAHVADLANRAAIVKINHLFRF